MNISPSIRSIKPILNFAPNGTKVIVGLNGLKRFRQRLSELGFSDPLTPGESVLPDSSFGPVSEVNAEGWVEVHKDRPMETAHRQVVWRWKMKRGWDYEWDEKLVDVPYKRYPRTEHPPIGYELRICPKTDGTLLLTLPELVVHPRNYYLLKHSVNLLVELFGECSILSADLNNIIKGDIKRLNWRILPPGKYPWERLKPHIKQIIAKTAPKTQEVIVRRLQLLNSFEPEFTAIGTHGFAGYLIFGFPQKHIHVLESIYFGNATYGLGKHWEVLSKLSKAELLNQRLHQFRVIHSVHWEHDIRRVLG